MAMLLTIAAAGFCDTAEDYYKRGHSKHIKHEHDGAITDFTKAIELKPAHVYVYYNRGDVKRTKGDLDGAIADYTQAIKITPNFGYAFHNRALSKEKKGDFDGALTDYSAIIKLNPKYLGAYINRGCLRYNLRDFTNSLLDFRRAIKLEPTNDYAHYRIWLLRCRSGDEKNEATMDLQKYLESRTGNPEDWANQIGRYLAGPLGEAEYLDAAKNANPKTEAEQLCEAYFYAGSKHLIQGDKAKATDYFQKSLATGQKTFLEYRSAEAELKFLKAQKN